MSASHLKKGADLVVKGQLNFRDLYLSALKGIMLLLIELSLILNNGYWPMYSNLIHVCSVSMWLMCWLPCSRCEKKIYAIGYVLAIQGFTLLSAFSYIYNVYGLRMLHK